MFPERELPARWRVCDALQEPSDWASHAGELQSRLSATTAASQSPSRRTHTHTGFLTLSPAHTNMQSFCAPRTYNMPLHTNPHPHTHPHPHTKSGVKLGEQAVSLHTFRRSVVILPRQSTDSSSHLKYAASLFSPEAMQVRGFLPLERCILKTLLTFFPGEKQARQRKHQRAKHTLALMSRCRRTIRLFPSYFSGWLD